jgi:hypothetical protein
MALKRLGQILIDLGLIDEMQLSTMLEEQSSRGGELIGRVGVALGYYTDEQLGEALAEQWGTTFVTLYDRTIPPDVLSAISEPMAQLYRVVPLELKNDRLRHPLLRGDRARDRQGDRQALFLAERQRGIDRGRSRGRRGACRRGGRRGP